MGGSGGGSYHPAKSTVVDLLRDSDETFDQQAYESEVNTLLQDALRDFNDRDIENDRERLDAVLEALQDDDNEALALRFGGSVRKHTYVDGLSDVDVLALITDTTLVERAPGAVLREFAGRLRDQLPGTEVEAGTLAVTIRYGDGREIQVLPALSTQTGVRIPSADGRRWSNVVRPDAFARKLTAVNQANGSRVVPVVKLFKAILEERLLSTQKFSGYHAESLAIEAFKSYDGRLTYKSMLRHLCSTSIQRVLTPIQDSTGQSLHVDDYLGEANSHARRQLSSSLERLSKRIDEADRTGDVDAWAALLGEEG